MGFHFERFGIFSVWNVTISRNCCWYSVIWRSLSIRPMKISNWPLALFKLCWEMFLHCGSFYCIFQLSGSDFIEPDFFFNESATTIFARVITISNRNKVRAILFRGFSLQLNIYMWIVLTWFTALLIMRLKSDNQIIARSERTFFNISYLKVALV